MNESQESLAGSAQAPGGPGGIPWNIVLGVCIVAAMGIWFFTGPATVQTPQTYTASERVCSVDGQEDARCLIMDGRRAGRIEFASEGRNLSIKWPRPMPIAGIGLYGAVRPVEVSLIGPAGTQSFEMKAEGIPALLESVVEVQEIRLTSGQDKGAIYVSEVEVFGSVPDTWLFTGGASGDAEMELFETYGIKNVGRITTVESLEKLLPEIKTLIVSNRPTKEPTRRMLRPWLAKGGTIIELGFRSTICGRSSTLSIRAESWRSEASKDDNALPQNLLWWGHIEKVNECNHDCGELIDQVTLFDGERTRLPITTSQRFELGRCHRWLGDVVSGFRNRRQGILREGEPDKDGVAGVQPADLFWNRLKRSDYDIPSADIWGLVLLEQLASHPGQQHFVHWLPSDSEGLLIMTADQDYAPAEALEAQAEALPSGSMTFLLTDPGVGAEPDVEIKGKTSPLNEQTAKTLLAMKADFGAHPNVQGLSAEQQKKAFLAHARNFHERFGRPVEIVRNHHLVWEGAIKTAQMQAMAGFRLNLDFMASAALPHGELGFMNGSALPARFTTEAGQVLPIYQQGTQLDDHVLLDARFGYRVHNTEQLIARSNKLIGMTRKYRLPLTINHHPYWWAQTGNAWQAALRDTAKQKGFPIWSAKSWLNFNDSRRQIRSSISNKVLTIDAPVGGGAILLEKDSACSDIEVDGQSGAATEWKPLRTPWCIVPLTSGRHTITTSR